MTNSRRKSYGEAASLRSSQGFEKLNQANRRVAINFMQLVVFNGENDFSQCSGGEHCGSYVTDQVRQWLYHFPFLTIPKRRT